MQIDRSPIVPPSARQLERECPSSPVVMYQRWEELLFLHWSFDPDLIAATLPQGLRLDTYDGRAWLGIVPFFMSGVRPRLLPALPGLSNFQEINLRTYVVDRQGRPGVWFYSLDTSHKIPNYIARTFFHLNYQWARMSAERTAAGCHSYTTARRCQTIGRQPEANFAWARQGECFYAQPDSLEFFLVERYRLFAYNSKQRRLYTGKIHHPPYSLQAAKLSAYSTQLFQLNGLPEPVTEPDSVLASAGVKVNIHPLQRG
ncbi:MAG: hypothetical protein ACI81V_001550 [Lentimonas sp.]|jgi:uncharacterized protein YqjF (DUF2071 family)